MSADVAVGSAVVCAVVAVGAVGIAAGGSAVGNADACGDSAVVGSTVRVSAHTTRATTASAQTAMMIMVAGELAGSFESCLFLLIGEDATSKRGHANAFRHATLAVFSGTVMSDLSLRDVRIEKRQLLEREGIQVHPDRYERTHTLKQIMTLEPGTKVRAAGRVGQLRKFGKLTFERFEPTSQTRRR